MDIFPSYVTIGKIFEQNFLFEVPKYQRYYAWEDEQVDDFIRDISALIRNHNSKDHFFGGIVCVEKPVPGSNRQQRELVDGQQRITTTMLLILSVYKKYGEILSQTSDEDITTIVKKRREKIERKYINYEDEINRKPVVVRHLMVSQADEECYEAIISGAPKVGVRDSHKKMNKAYEKLFTFVSRSADERADCNEKINVLADIEDVIDKCCTIIFIDAKTKRDAYALFQVLNDRGMGLTVGDLLKSKTLEIVAKDSSSKEEDYILGKWDEILSGASKAVDRFLRYYYMSVMGKRAGTNSLFDDYIENIFEIKENKAEYTEEEKAEVVSIVEAIYEASCKFYKIQSGEWPFEDKQPITIWDRNRLKNLIDYLDYEITLALLISATELSHTKFNEIVQILEKFMFRYKGICNNKHQKVADIFMKEAKYIRENLSEYRVSHLTQQLRPLIISDAGDTLFKENLKSLKYIKKGSNKLIKYLLATLNEYHKWCDEGANGKPHAETGTVINFENVSIEHIFSQNPQDGVEATFDINELRNLTLLTLEENGDRVRNKPYADKRKIYIESEYHINTKFEQYEEWSQENMDDWLSYLLDLSCKVFTV